MAASTGAITATPPALPKKTVPATPLPRPALSAVSPRVSWLVDAHVGATRCRCLLDTGAEYTIVRRGLLPPDPGAPDRPLLQAQGPFARDGVASMYGPRLITITIEDVALPMHVYEADTWDDCLLGGDFVAAHVERFDPGLDRMFLRGGGGSRSVALERVTRPAHGIAATLRVCSLGPVTIPAHTEILVPVRVSNCGKWQPSPEAPAPQSCSTSCLSPCDLANHSGLGGGSHGTPVGGPPPVPESPSEECSMAVGRPTVGTAVGRSTVGMAVGRSTEEMTVGRSTEGPAPQPPPPDTDSIVRVSRTRCAAVPVTLPSGLAAAGTLLLDEDGETLLLRVRNHGETPRLLRGNVCLTQLRVDTEPRACTVCAAPTMHSAPPTPGTLPEP